MSSAHLALLELGYWRQLAQLQRLLVHDIGNLQVGYQYAQQKVAELDGKMLAIGAHLRKGFAEPEVQPSMADIADVMHELQSTYNEPVTDILQENGPRLGVLLGLQRLFSLYEEPLKEEAFSLSEIFTPLQNYFFEQCTRQRLQITLPSVMEAVVQTSPGALALVSVTMLQVMVAHAQAQGRDQATRPHIEFRHALVLPSGADEQWLLLEVAAMCGVAERDDSVATQRLVWQPNLDILSQLDAGSRGDLHWALSWLELVGGGAKWVAVDGGQRLVCGLPVRRLS